MNKLKRILAFGLSAILLAAFTACGGGTGSSTAPSAPGTTEGEPAASGDKTVITVWTKDRHDAEYMQAAVDEYNATNTDNIEVVYEIYSDNYIQAVDMVFQSGEAPDLFVFQEQVFFNYVNAGKYADLTPYMDDDFKAVFGELMYEGHNVIDGKVYYVPTAATTCRLFYNKEIFERLNLEVPTTLEDMVAAAQTITAELSGEGIYGFAANMKGAQSALGRSMFPMAELELGIRQGYDYAAGQYDFTGYKAIVEQWSLLLANDVAFPGCESLDIDPLRTQFADGKIGMYFSYTHAEPGVYDSQFPMDAEKWGCAYIPVSGGNITGKENFTPMNGYLFNAESENLDAAWKVYVDLLANVDVLTGYYEAGLGISMVPTVVANASAASYYTENPALLIGSDDALLAKTPHEVNPEGVVVEGLNMYDTIAAIIAGDIGVEAGLQDLTDRYNAAYETGKAAGLVD